MLYPDKKHNIGEMMQQVQARKEREREKLKQFPEELGLTLQEFDEFSQVDQESSVIGGGSKRKAEDDPSVYLPYSTPEQPNNPGRSKRAAAVNARSYLSSINEDGAL